MAINIVPGITHTVLVNDAGVTNPACVGIVDIQGANLLSLRTMPNESRVLTLNGRATGTILNLTKYSVFDYQMRRKAETLKHRKNEASLSKKQKYAQISKAPGGSYYYSSQGVTQELINNLNCPTSNLGTIIRPPTNSGVHDYKYPGYYFDSNVPYLSSL
jgi:hypothetical protein